MATAPNVGNVGPVPQRTPLVDRFGNLTMIWHLWFEALLLFILTLANQDATITVATSATPVFNGALNPLARRFYLNNGATSATASLSNLRTAQAEYTFIVRMGVGGKLTWNAQFIDFPQMSVAEYPTGTAACVVRCRGWWDGASKMYCMGSMGDK